jgi:hypothetical protein
MNTTEQNRRTVVQVRYMMRIVEPERSYWLCVRCRKWAKNETAAMKHACGTIKAEGSEAKARER